MCVVVFLFGVCSLYLCFFFFFKQKTAYEMRISDWRSDVCSSDLLGCMRRIDDMRRDQFRIPFGSELAGAIERAIAARGQIRREQDPPGLRDHRCAQGKYLTDGLNK